MRPGHPTITMPTVQDKQKEIAFFDAHADVLSARLYKLGTYYCLAGRGKAGRQAFYKSIAHSPLTVKSYIGVVLSFTGQHTLRWLYETKEMLTE